ncbi:MAG: hypothetical protein WDA09_11065, partial [Bacteriovoracaceae bacterium]
MLGEKRPEFNNSESSQKTEKQIQEQRRRESIAAMAREERKKRIAQQLEKASKKAEEPAPSEDRKSEKRVPKRMFSQIAEAMLQQRRETGPVQEQEIAELELAIKEINRVVNASELSKEKRIKVIVDHLRGRKLAEESLVAVLQSLDGSDSSIPKEQANEILRAIIKQNKEAYQTVLDSLEDPEEKNAVQKGTEKKPEPKPALGVEVEAFTQQRTKRAERVANHRQLTQIEERIKSLKAKDQRTLTTAEKEELEDLEKQKQELLLKQFENIEGSHFIDYQGNQQETTIANYLLDLDKLEALIETGDNIPEMIPSEAEKFNTIKSFLKKPEVQSQLQALREATDTATKQQLLQDSENLIKLLEQISNPLIAGRIELNAKRKESASTISKEMDYSRLSDLAEEFAQYEDWKRNAPVEDRIAAAREDFMTKILLLNLEDFDETDLYLTLQEFNLGSVAVDRKGKIEWAINTSLERNHQAEVLNLIRTAEKIKKQHELAWQIVGYERDQDNEQLASQADFVDAVQSDLISIFNKVKQPEDTESLSDTRIAQETQSPKRLESETFLRDLYHKGIVSLEITPTGVTFVVNSYLIGETSEAAFKQLMRAVGQEEQLSKINETGLGLTLKEEALTNLQGHIKGEVVPSVSIIVLPEDPTQRNVEASIQLHETTDYLLESFDSQQINQLRQDHGFETIPEAIGRGLRELTSRINDGTLAENPQIHYFLDNLYITKDDKLSSQEQESIMRLVRIVESILRTKPPEFDENTQQLQDAVRRSQLAFDIRSKLRRLAVEHAQIENIVDKVTQELAKEYSINIPDVQRDTYFSSSPEVGDKGFHKYISYASATGGPAKKQSYIGISDSTNPLNKGLDE